VRANTQGESFAYYPYGEERTTTPDGRDKFGTYFRDGVGQDYADQRYYNAGMGRFWSPDPGGIRTADPTDPGSWNRYAYTEGDPVNFGDPTGQSRIAFQTICGFQGGVLATPSPEGSLYDNNAWSCQIGTISTVTPSGKPTSAFPKCNTNGDPIKEVNLNFIADHWADAVDVAAANGVSGDWILAWSAQESGSVNAQGFGQGWGTIKQAGSNQNNFFGETAGAWTNQTTCGAGTVSKYACFASYYDSASAAFASFGGKYGQVLSNAYASGETDAQAFQQIAPGWDPGNSNYGANIQSTLRTLDPMISCMMSNGYIF
jgi:RHS repeat-associated protein